MYSNQHQLYFSPEDLENPCSISKTIFRSSLDLSKNLLLITIFNSIPRSDLRCRFSTNNDRFPLYEQFSKVEFVINEDDAEIDFGINEMVDYLELLEEEKYLEDVHLTPLGTRNPSLGYVLQVMRDEVMLIEHEACLVSSFHVLYFSLIFSFRSWLG